MHKTLSMLQETRRERADGDKGFTLIELLVVVVILGVLIAVAIPLYLNYRKGANDAAAQSDLRNTISVMEVCNADNAKYPTAAVTFTAASTVAGTCTGQKVLLSSGTSLQYTPDSTAGASYIAVSTNSNGGGKFYCYNSTKGGGVAQVTAASLSAATC